MMEKIIDIFTYNIDYLLLHDIINLMNSNKKLNKIPFRKTVILFVDNITDCINKHCDEAVLGLINTHTTQLNIMVVKF